jgi:hypothetical protein
MACLVVELSVYKLHIAIEDAPGNNPDTPIDVIQPPECEFHEGV